MANLPDRANVVVVGGGIIGCSILYHLAKLGIPDCILVERHQIASGTTWHAAALVSPVRPPSALTELGKYSIQLYNELERETGQATGWRQCGHLNIAASKDRFENLKHTASVSRGLGFDVQIIGPKEAKEKWPLLRTDDLEGAIWNPISGRANPTDICQALLKGARTHGGRFYENTPVVGFEMLGGRVRGVHTAQGLIKCDTVVLCAGLWSHQVAKMAGAVAPLYACEHIYLLTDSIPGVTSDLPVLRDGDAYLYIREEVGGLLVGCFEPNPKPLPVEKLSPSESFILLNEDWDHFQPMMENAIHRIPALETAGARKLINGPESFTLDHNPLLGEMPGVHGFFVACGMNSGGIMMAGGVGKVMSEWVTRGRPSLDLWPTDIRRFGPYHNNVNALSKRIPEVLAHHFEIPWPGKDYETVRGIRRTPLHSALASRGAYFSQRAGWERPMWFSPNGAPQRPRYSYGPQDWFPHWKGEHLAARNAAAVFDQSPFGKLLVQGRDAELFLDRVCANDMTAPPGKVVYTSMLNPDGGIESDLTVTRLKDDAYLLITGSQQSVRDADWLRRNIDREHVTVTDMTSAYATLTLCGPQSRQLLSRLTPAALDNRGFPYGTAQEIDVAYATALALRISYAGELGWELYIASEFAPAVFEALVDAGKDLGLRLAGANALNSLRIEKSFRSWGHDIGPTDTPFEAGLRFAVRLNKQTPFVGRDALLRQRDKGISRRLVNFVFEDPGAFPHGNEPIYRNGERCGVVTSASYGHSFERAVAIGTVRGKGLDDKAIVADEYQIEIADRRFTAKAHVKAIYDPDGSRMRA